MTDRDLLTSRELDSRVSAGLHVRLVWDEVDGGLSVAVVDRCASDAFVVTVPDGVRPLDVFHHPYAYAASRGARRIRRALPGAVGNHAHRTNVAIEREIFARCAADRLRARRHGSADGNGTRRHVRGKPAA